MSATAFQRRRRAMAQPNKSPVEPKEPSIPSRDEIAEMRKPEVKEWLEAHGVDDPKGTVAELRDVLAKTIYAGL